MQKIRVVHADDDSTQLEIVGKIFAGFKNVELQAQFTNAEDAAAFILRNNTDLAILDVEMPGKNGLWLANEIKSAKTLIVFLTAYPDYSLKAFEACAIHYILKPVSHEQVQEILSRYEKLQTIAPAGQLQPEQVTELIDNYFNNRSFPRRIFINTVHKTSVINLNEVMYLQSSGAYTIFKLANGSGITSSKLLKTYETALQNHPSFARVHRTHMVNKNFVKAVLRNKQKTSLQMNDGAELEVSQAIRESVYELLSR
ncbi:MAG: LytTR family DNA-binding domain-containing protein [Ferruginibacter sp.]